MRTLLRLAAVAVVACGIAHASAAQAPAAADNAVRWAHPALWRIENGSTTVYLFGSVHIIPGNVAWSDDDIDSAMRRADVFVFEASLSGQALADMIDVVRERGRLPRGQTLRELLSAEGLKNYLAVLQQLGLPAHAFDQYRPWLALLVISMRHTHSQAVTAPGTVDPVVMGYAQSHGREMRYFETARQQFEIFGNMDPDDQLAVFEASLTQYNEQPRQTAAVIDAWAKGDSDGLATMLAEGFKDVPPARRAIVDDRNRAWARQIENYLKEPNRTFFITVGAGHYGGQVGVVALLCRGGAHVMLVGRNGAADSSACGRRSGR